MPIRVYACVKMPPISSRKELTPSELLTLCGCVLKGEILANIHNIGKERCTFRESFYDTMDDDRCEACVSHEGVPLFFESDPCLQFVIKILQVATKDESSTKNKIALTAILSSVLAVWLGTQ